MCPSVLICVHNSYFIMCSFSLTVQNHKRIPFALVFGDSGHSTPQTMPSGSLQQLTGFAWVHQVCRWKLHTCFHLGTVSR
jgi:hypothetical protein